MDMRTYPSRVDCERARPWAALAPDGELSELERRLLDSHLAQCGACRAFFADVAATTRALRTAEYEALAEPVSVLAWRRRERYARLRAVAASAAVAVMALGLASRAPLATTERNSTALPRITDFSESLQREAAQLRAVRHAGITAAGSRTTVAV
jgi:predicted anti-sigma-YlaC factor YlaD